ncbi:hypothetical protein Rumeso_02825 [Rubellimicrobium mesophilum DSM 19309]|uniref:Uncharacterized protein n=1 Tax=Rubellimicrobium mesophilum DSM 19309 TaxID=442562 RepID=A0A017HPD2_9RHOB|nr:hypothetical protein [Rubellimicrobium mesophilum]EYD75609.1 hypothetical protein Rumeso_02825 [Rubellimicrobium mesophilum DSM 19309]
METRSTRSTVTFAHPFHIAGYEDELPAGDYEVVVDEDLLQGLSFEAYRRSATYLLIGGRTGGRGISEMRPIDPRDLDAALARDQAQPEQS